MRHRTLPRQLAASAIVSLILAGGLTACGGDETGASPESSTSADSVTDTETDTPVVDDTFVADANAVCTTIYPDINAVGQTLDPADPTTVTTDFLPLVQQLQDELVALTPPADLADAYAAVLAEQQVNLDSITADPAALFELDGSATDDKFDALGLLSCGSGSVDIPAS